MSSTTPVQRSSEILSPNAPEAPVRSTVTRLGLIVLVLLILAVLGSTLNASNTLELEYIISLSLFAVATNLLLGFGGLVSFGQAVFYGAGTYTVALAWMHHSLSFSEAMILAPVVGAVIAVPLGLLALRTRRLYFSLLTLTFSQLAYVIVENQTNLTGGTNGVFGSMIPNWLLSPRNSFFFIFIIAVVSIAVLWKITRSPFGLVLQAIRDNRERVEALGVNVFAHELVAFVISGFFCALAGALFVVYSQSAYPEVLMWTNSGVPVFMAVIGGMFSFAGPIIGAFVYELANHFLIQYTQDWQLVLGVVLLAIVLLRPDGLAGGVSSLLARLRRFRRRTTTTHANDDLGQVGT